GEGEARILADRDVAFEGEDLLAVVGDRDAAHEIRRNVVPAHLVHLHPGAVRMADEEMSLERLAEARLSGKRHLHAAEPLQRQLLVLAGRRRAAARRLDELRDAVE